MKYESVASTIKKVLSKNKILSILLSSAILGVVIFNIVPAWILKNIIDNYLGKVKMAQLVRPALLFFASYVLVYLFEFAKEGLLTITGQKITHEIRLSMMKKEAKIKANYFTLNETGTIVSRFMNDVEAVQSLFTNGIIGLFIDGFKIIGIMISLYLINKQLSLLLLIILPFLYVITRYFQKQMLKAQYKNRIITAKVNNHIPETINNIQMIQSFHKETYMKEKYKEYLKESYATINQINYYDALYSPIVLIIKAVMIALVVILASKDIHLFGVSVGMVAAAIELISNIFAPIEGLGMELQSIQEAVAGIKRVNEFLCEEEEQKHIELKLEPYCNKRYHQIQFDKVSFSYDEDTPILREASFIAKYDDKITFVGRTGVGKSTIFKLLLGLLEPQQGDIYLNGKSVKEIPNEQKRSIFGYVEQEFHFIPGNIVEQIRLNDEKISEDQVYRAMKFVGLDTYVRGFDQGYFTIVNDTMFSQGQKQLLSIARAIVADPPILLLDEITANLDSKTEEMILKVLEQVSQHRMVLSISHRLSARLTNNRVLVVKDNMISE